MGDHNNPKRALILAGGGMKVAWQAGVLQVWLDEAGLKFDVFDGASGGVFQLAMVCQGMSGKQIADNWRNIDPIAAVGINWGELPKLIYGESLFTAGNFEKNVFPKWGLDFEKIRTTTLNATFNVYNFTDHQLEVIEPAQLTPELFTACFALPMWFPPVLINGKHYIDAVYSTDANLEEAIRRGADELWVIWSVSFLGDWEPGFVATYFQIIEAAANGRYNAVLKRIETNNQNLAAGNPGEFGRHITVREIRGEVPLQYLINVSQDRFREAVEMGVGSAREWCRNNNLAFTALPPGGLPDTTKLWFTEEMKGFVGNGPNFEQGFNAGQTDHEDLMFHLTITVDGVYEFVTTEGKWARAEGWVSSRRFGQKLSVEQGWFNLFQDQPDAPGNAPNPIDKLMLYRLFFADKDGNPLTLSGMKTVHRSAHSDLWHDTTTLFTNVFRGHVGADQEASATVEATGILRLHLLDFLRQLTTFKAQAPTEKDRVAVLSHFGTFFMGNLWDVYGRRVLEYGPW
ncbi:MAG: hypothetical protein E6J20_04095 [Chloroflexi bacterium]|nr:MAG: hypothetical protein E6J20_04095 [Chloroflexota bacterium]